MFPCLHFFFNPYHFRSIFDVFKMNYSTLAQWCNEPLPQFLKFKSMERAADQYRISFTKSYLFLQINLSGKDNFCFFTQDDTLDFTPAFSGVMSLFQNAVLSEISPLGNDRILSFLFHKRSIYGENLLLKIVVELIPGKLNIIFLEENKILQAKKIYSFADNPERQILSGQKYLLPVNKNKQEICYRPLPWHDQDYSFESVNDYLEHFFYNHIHLQRLAIIKNREENQRKKKIEKAETKLAHLRATWQDYSKTEYWKMAGELLKSAYHTITPGLQEISIVNYCDPKMPKIIIKLKKELSPRQNVDLYFKKYKKGINGKKIIESRIKMTEAEIQNLKNQPDYSQEKAEYTPKAKPNEKKSLKQIKINEILKIVIGRNDAENNTITCKLAGKTDLWFHTRAIRGSHIVIFNPYKKDVPQKIIEIAAGLAAYYSKAKHSGKVAVDYTHIRYVWKIRKGRLGQVNYKNQKTVFTKPRSMREVKKELNEFIKDTSKG